MYYRQLNYIRYKHIQKKLCNATAPVVRKKSDYRANCAYSDYCAKKDNVALEKVAFFRAIISNIWYMRNYRT